MILVCSWVMGYEFWILPRLFDESITFVESFKPLYTFEQCEAGQGYYRLATLVFLISSTVWLANQPDEFDEFIIASRKFTEDLYSGNLLPDRSEQDRRDIDKVKVPTLEELVNDNAFGEEEEEDIVSKAMDEMLEKEEEEKKKASEKENDEE